MVTVEKPASFGWLLYSDGYSTGDKQINSTAMKSIIEDLMAVTEGWE